MLTYPDYVEKSIVICNTNQKQKLSFLNDNIVIKDEDDKIILQNSCYRIFSLWIIGSITITSGVLERSKKFAFSIYLFNYSFKCYGVWASVTEGNFLLREKQYNFNGIHVARFLIKNKIGNQVIQLKSIRSKNSTQKNNIELLEKYITQINDCDSIQSIMGIEGISSRLYFEAWFWESDWKGRKPRAKRDILNVLMDIGYTYLFNIVESMLNLYGFDLYKGVLHQNFYQRKSLVCDIVEPFRVIIDRQLMKAYNLKQIKEDDFILQKGQYVLKYDKSKTYTQWMVSSVLEHKGDIFIFVQQYYRWFIKNKIISDFPSYNYIP
jgi:CRISPR-associated protein Cas1